MPIVLIVRDASLRSAWVARLSIAGANLITAADLDSPGLRRAAIRPALLVVDEASVGTKLGAILEDPRWHRIVVLAASPPAPDPNSDARVIYVQGDATAALLSEHVPGWRPEIED